VWDKFKRQVQVDLEQISGMFHMHYKLLEKCQTECPNTDEIPAVAAILHSFYTGVENIFKRIAIEIDGLAPTGAMWHSQLLQSMVSSNSKRPAVISHELYEDLQEYLDFRHVFRHAYTFDLKWVKMASLAQRSGDMLHRLENELQVFLKTL